MLSNYSSPKAGAEVPVPAAKKVTPKRLWWAIIFFPIWVLAAYVASSLITSIILEILVALHVPLKNIDESILETVVALIVYGFSLLLTVGLPWIMPKLKHWQLSWKELGFTRWPSWSDIIWGPVGFAIAMILATVLLSIAKIIVPALNVDQSQDTGYSGIHASYQYYLAFFTLVILAPLAEETLFRGFLFGRLRTYLPAWVAVVVSAGLFGLVHGQWNLGITMFAMGVVLASLRQLTGSIWAGVMLHMVKNGVAFYFLFISPLLLLH